MDFNKYKNTLPYPSKSNVYTCECGKTHQVKCEYDFCANCGQNIRAKIAETTESVVKQRGEYNNEERRLMEAFKTDLLAEHGLNESDVVTIPVSALYSYAWNEGHSSGLESVANVFDDIVGRSY